MVFAAYPSPSSPSALCVFSPGGLCWPDMGVCLQILGSCTRHLPYVKAGFLSVIAALWLSAVLWQSLTVLSSVLSSPCSPLVLVVEHEEFRWRVCYL